MDLDFYNGMDILTETSSPPINVGSRVANTFENSLSNSAGGTMDNRSLSDVATADATVATGVNDSADVVQSVAQTFPVSLPRLELKLPILSSSSSDSESEDPSNPTAGTSTGADGERVASPPPNCAICLGRCKNKCFTDSCMHQFCFKCLCEWSKVKPECPLCKQTFKSIIHNVKSIHQFEEYHVQPPTVQIAHPSFDMDFPEMRIFGVVHQGHNRNQAWNDSTHRPLFFRGISAALAAANTNGSTTSGVGAAIPTSASGSNGGGGGLRNQYVYRGELLDLYRQEYPDAIASSGTLSQLWRRYVYDRKLYSMPVADITGHFRESSARFYRDNPAQIHRLMPWINRDIVCLLRQTQHDVTSVLESITSALILMNILSPGFRRRIQPYLGTKTAHFIHELNNFARSPYDMIGYDRAVQYSTQTNHEDIVIEFTSSEDSSDNEHIDILNSGNDGGSGSGNNARSTTNLSTSSNASINAINLTIHNRLTSASNSASGRGVNGVGGDGSGNLQDDVSLVIDLRGESDHFESSGNRESTLSANLHDIFQHSLEDDGDMMMMPAMMPSVSDNIELTSGSSDECEFVLERKPPHLRTPEMVSLDSASDSDVVFVEELQPLNKTSFSSSEGEQPPKDAGTDDHHNTRSSATASTTATTTRSKITALVEAKKRNHSANLVKNETAVQQDIYSVGASTSAALRLSLQKRGDKSHKSDHSGRLRREKYALRNTERQTRTERGGRQPKSRGKRLDSESSHSSTSRTSSPSTTTTSSASTSSTTTANSTSSTSDEEYVASVAQRKKMSSSGGGCGVGVAVGVGAENQSKRRKPKRTKKRKTSIGNSTTKRDATKRKKTNNDDDTSGDDEEDNGHMGKNFALVIAHSERMKRQNQKHPIKAQTREIIRLEKEADDSEGEYSWRQNAINEPLRKKQQQQLQSSQKSNDRKRYRKTATQRIKSTDNRTEQKEKKRRKVNDEQEHEPKQQQQHEPTQQQQQHEPTQQQQQQKQKQHKQQHASINKKTESTSSDESDNINLVQLKSILIGGCQENNNSETNAQQLLSEILHEEPPNPITGPIKEEIVTTSSPTTLDHPPEQPPGQSQSPSSPISPCPPHPPTDIVEYSLKNDTQNTSDSSDSNDNDDDDDDDDNDNDDDDDDDDNKRNYGNTNEQILPAAAADFQQHIDQHLHHPHHHDENPSNNISSTMNLPESNVFVDGTSMSTTTTTTDTILHDAAEQISSAAVNFYNTQQTFNTADFAADDENSVNSSSSDSSMSSSTTSISSSSNSSSSNTNTDTFVNYEHP